MTRGGYRPGAGRKKNSGKYGEATVTKRIPISLASLLEEHLQQHTIDTPPVKEGEAIAALIAPAKTPTSQALPLFGARVAAGFPSPADDFIENTLDLNEYLVPHPAATFFVRVAGESMKGGGILPGDILVVDRALPVKNNAIVIAAVNGELTVKRYYKHNNEIQLRPENPDFKPITLLPGMELHIWGVVTSVIHQV